jgi:signal transduction histidine kinase
MSAFVEGDRIFFVVFDLAQDSRFGRYRSTFPNDRFYVAVPIRTPTGVVIGSIGVYGDTPRDKVDDEHLRLLQDRAGTVMDYLATLRTMREGCHGERMIKALGVFMEGKSSTGDRPAATCSPDEKQSPDSDASSTRPDPVTSIHLANSQKMLDIPPSHIPQIELGMPLRNRLTPYRSRSPAREVQEGSGIPKDTCRVLHRACDLIRNALDVDGVIFLDISPFNHERHGISSDISSNPRSRSRDVAGHERSTSQMLAYSFSEDHNQTIDVPTSLLRDLVLRYARGGIFHSNDRFTPLGNENHSDSIAFSSPVEGIIGDDMRKLSHVFSGSNSVAFFPLWDFHRTRWFAGCFTWTKDPRRVFTASQDLTYLAAFNNSIMAEISRLDLRAADREKADFISSVSHEWRSPLHGILNMLDILKETTLNTSQQYLLDVTTNCAKTLADTVNHVLDYGKINSLIGPTRHDREHLGASQRDSPFHAPALINQVNMATLVEEVAEALLASQDYLGPNAEALFSAAEQTVDRPFRESNIPNTIPRAIFAIVDVEWRASWECSVSAGAWRRIILNLFGNALKFTPSGFVQLKLRREDTLKVGSEDQHPAILIQISDSGRGISPDFSSNLYTPFQQEDSLSTGLGVGLNIVYRIVDSLHGLIDLRSEPDHGTVVSVLLPVTMAQPSSPLPVSYAGLREKLAGKTVSLFRDSSKYGDLNVDPEVFSAILTSMEEMITQWFGVHVLTPNEQEGEHADIIIVTEHEYDYASANKSTALYGRHFSPRKHPATSFPVIVLCKLAHSWFKKPLDPREQVVFLQQPISPRTLAKALMSCLEQSTASSDAEDEVLKEEPPTPSNCTSQHRAESDEWKSAGYSKTGTRDTQMQTNPSNCNHLKQHCKVLLVEDNNLNLKVGSNYLPCH